MLTFRGLSVTFVHCAQTAEDIGKISFAHENHMSLPDRAGIWLRPTSLDLSSPNFALK